MKLTQLDVQQQQFRQAFRGFAKEEVTEFLDLVAQQLGELTRENNDFRLELRRATRELEEYREREVTLKEAMLTAQRAIEEIREQAQKEAQLMLSEAEMRAERVLDNAHRRVTRILEEIGELKRQRVRAIEEIRGLVNTHARLLEAYEIHDDLVEEEASVTVFTRVRAPSPPRQEDLGLVKLNSRA